MDRVKKLLKDRPSGSDREKMTPVTSNEPDKNQGSLDPTSSTQNTSQIGEKRDRRDSLVDNVSNSKRAKVESEPLSRLDRKSSLPDIAG